MSRGHLVVVALTALAASPAIAHMAIKAKDAMTRVGVPAQKVTELERGLALAEAKLNPSVLDCFSL